jgi:hypothetical protein
MHAAPKIELAVGRINGLKPKLESNEAPEVQLDAELKQTPRANCVVSYRRKETMVASLDGKVACKLSKHLYGVDQWWVLLKQKA